MNKLFHLLLLLFLISFPFGKINAQIEYDTLPDVRFNISDSIYDNQYFSLSWDSTYLDFYVENDTLFINTNANLDSVAHKFLNYIGTYIDIGNVNKSILNEY